MLCSREGSNCRHTGKGTLPPSGKAPLSCCRYVTVDEDAGRALYYVFQESLGKPDSDPLVLWLNGGPGCSSLAGGFLSELGPFYPTADGELRPNEFTWTSYANIIFLESPAFVGWSYSNSTQDLAVGDERTAQDAYQFLQGFLEKFPQYRDRPLWIAGESYGGHYVPNLSQSAVPQIAKNNVKAASGQQMQLQGFMIGNPWTDADIDNRGVVDFMWNHAVISDKAADALLDNCNFSHIGPLLQGQAANGALSDTASAKVKLASISAVSGHEVMCPWVQPRMTCTFSLYLHAMSVAPLCCAVPYDPCVDNEVEVYFNRRDVQDELHANMSGSLPGPWKGCNQEIQYSMDDLFSSVLPVHREIQELEKPLKILVFSGNVDGVVPVVGTRRWVTSLNLTVSEPWRAWYSRTGQVGGFTEGYDGLRFATVRNAGHMVPFTQSERSMHLFARWVHGQQL
eukprot:jgi/Astpho2/6219/e_gw1.00088.45.1_t